MIHAHAVIVKSTEFKDSELDIVESDVKHHNPNPRINIFPPRWWFFK
jgi:hypothetical protein